MKLIGKGLRREHRPKRTRVLTLVLAAAVPVFGLFGNAAMAEPAIDIPATDMRSALNAYIRQSGLQLIYREEDVKAKRSSRVRGQTDEARALDQLLRGSGLTATREVSGAIAIVKASGVLPEPDARFQAETPAEIVVSALKRETRLQETPLTATALPADKMSAIHATQFADLVGYVPGLQVNEIQVGQRRISIRGVQSAGEATVGMYYDETSVTGVTTATNDPSGAVPDVNLFDAARVEVLRGPQGTMFGSGSMSGTVRIVFKKPDAKAAAGLIETQFGSTSGGASSETIRGMMNIPLIADTLALRLAAYREGEGGWIDNVRLGLRNTNHSEVRGARMALGYRPGDHLSLLASYVDQATEVADSNAYYPSLGLRYTDDEARIPFDSKIKLYNLTLDYDLTFAKLTATTSKVLSQGTRYIDSTRSARAALESGSYCSLYFALSTACSAQQLSDYQDWGKTQLPMVGYQPMSLKSQTAEVRLTSPKTSPIVWTLGTYYEDRSDFSTSYNISVDPKSGRALYPYNILSGRYVGVDQVQTALFGDIVYPLNERLALNVGIRAYSYDKLTRSQVTKTGYLNGSLAGPANLKRTTATGLVKKLSLSYEPGPGTLVYATYSEGFRPGGTNNVPGLPEAQLAYTSDTLKNFEAGAKSQWFDHRLTLNGALYRIDWDNMQVAARVISGPYRFITNTGASRIIGLEMESAISPHPSLSFSSSLNVLLESKLLADQTIANAVASGRRGDRIPDEPIFTASILADWRKSLGGSLVGIYHADYTYVGKAYSVLSTVDQKYAREGEYGQLNLSAGLSQDEWQMTLAVQNLFDVAGIVRVTSGPNAFNATNSSRPRTVSLSLKRRF